MEQAVTAQAFLARLEALGSDEERVKYRRYFKTGADQFIGVRMGQVFALGKEFRAMPVDELERLLESDIHEARSGALTIMTQQYGSRKTPEEVRQALFELYLRRLDRIDNWDLVDLAAYKVVGAHLVARPRDLLHRLAESKNMWERRTAIVATFAFVRRGDLDDTFAIAERLLPDPEDLVRKAVGWALRTAGDKDRDRLLGFLDRHAAAMPRVALRYAIEKLQPAERAHYLGLKRAS